MPLPQGSGIFAAINHWPEGSWADYRTFATVFKNKLDGRAQALAAFFHAAPLTISAGNLRGPGDKPFAITLNDCCEFVPHGRV
jgi:hypothetical protein